MWAFVFVYLIDTENFALIALAVVGGLLFHGAMYGPQAAFLSELFGTKVRYSGVSVGYALGAILGGAFAATIAQWIVSTYDQSWLIGVYIVILSAISFIAVSMVKDPMGVDLNIREVHEEYLRQHPEAVDRDPGVAGEPAR